MNPFFEQCWRDAHTMLVAYMRDAVQEKLPEDLKAMAEEQTVTLGSGESSKTYVPDVKLIEPWSPEESEDWPLRETAPATEPIRVFMDDEVERWLEIRDADGRLITVIELLSPANKRDLAGVSQYISKRDGFISAGVNVVEIDLVRQGSSVFPNAVRNTLNCNGACHGVCVFRAAHPVEREVYPIRLRERLPAIRIPLRAADADVTLDLQPLIDQCHERGRYHMLDYRWEPDPPLASEDAAWMDSVLRESGLR